MTRLLATLLLIGAAPLAAQATDPVGVWQIEEATSWIRIERTPAGSLLGRLVWVAEPDDSLGRPKTDINNPDKSRRGDPILGMQILTGFREGKPGEWKDGTIYDGRNGKSYRGTITLAGTDSLKLRGYIKIGFVKAGRTSVWTRIRRPVAPDSGSALYTP